eukprot:TRINITY_DN204_c0_g1_i1.p1 TRINITY_DN204_c0_g1~~TRINITY_DN204_c0_g1_i1.p1  ORF type:complete len:250 (-),score=95.03 TRINITY_DN204_c0_g1_i1:192-872(-)
MFACRACTSSDPVTDTVKVNFAAATAEDKENCDSLNTNAADAQVEKEAAEERRRQEEAAAAAARAEEERLQAELAAKEQEQKRLEQERIEEQRRLEAAEADRAAREAAEAEEAARREQQEEEARMRAEQEEAQRKEQEKADSEKLQAFLKQHGYKDAKTKRTKMFKSKYPLHSAVKLNDARIVKLLLEQGADATAKNSAGQTPATVAHNLQKDGSHTQVLALLEGC